MLSVCVCVYVSVTVREREGGEKQRESSLCGTAEGVTTSQAGREGGAPSCQNLILCPLTLQVVLDTSG